MKRFLVVLTAAAVAGVIYVAAAPGGQTVTPTARQFAALKKQVSLLSKKVKAQGVTISALKKAEASVKTEADGTVGFLTTCLGTAFPVNEFGDATNGAFGYHYLESDGTTEVKTTAIDIDPAATPGAYFQGVASSCVSGTSGLRKMGALTEHRVVFGAPAKH